MFYDTKANSDPVRRRLRRLTRGEVREEALQFVRQFHRENDLSMEGCRQRQKDVAIALARTGHYRHTVEELVYGARLAWRNHARCIGRLFWKSLEVIDCRHICEPDAVAAAIFNHMKAACGDGRVRSMVTVFAPATREVMPVTCESAQVIQYAGYLFEDGTVLGDRMHIELTRTAAALGWQAPAPRTAFDVLPLILRDSTGRRHVYDIPADANLEVRIEHPVHAGLAALGLKWYAVPCVSSMVLTIGGIDYPCAPFNGYYMETEIGSRDLCDERRYDLMDPVATALGISREGLDNVFWKDITLTELNRAVLWSYRQAGVTIVDHHTASQQFMEFSRLEQAAGRVPSARWSWIVPPQASSACPVFHLPMRELAEVPNFYRSRADDGGALTISYVNERRGRWRMRLDRIKRRYRNWLRRNDFLERF